MSDARFVFPEGFERHYGEGCPVDPEQYVETIIRTAEGYGSGGVTKAEMHDWEAKTHEPEAGLGEVVGYRLVHPEEPSRFSPNDRF